LFEYDNILYLLKSSFSVSNDARAMPWQLSLPPRQVETLGVVKLYDRIFHRRKSHYDNGS
jgi:hypothetical protein